MSVNIANARLVLGEELVEGGISIRNGRINRICKTTLLPKAERTIDGKGMIAIPGLVDAHVHLRDMRLSYKEDFASGTLAAAAGGFTTVLDMPNTEPPTNSDERLVEKVAKARTSINVNVGFYAYLVESVVDIRKMMNAGAIAFKLFMNESNLDAWHRDHQRLLSSVRECGAHGIPVAVHAEDGSDIERIQMRCIKNGMSSVHDFERAHAPRLELEAISTITDLAHRAHARMHICHVSTRQSLREIHYTRKKGAKITCEVTPHHLFLDSSDMKRRRGLALMVPPLRRHRDGRALWKALLNADIDMIASDHAPHSLEEKTSNNVWEIRPGLPGLETTLPLMLTRVRRDEISLADVARLLAENPARIFGLQGKGHFEAGMSGDVVLIDPKARFKIDSSKFYSKAHFSPFDGAECVGRPVVTIVGGHVVFDHGEIVEKNQGKIVTRGVGA